MKDFRKRKGKKLLEDLVTFLNQNTPESKQLWAILAALRGPDRENMDLKAKTVGRVRFAIGLVPGIGNSIGVSSRGPDEEDAPFSLTCYYGNTDHVLRKYGACAEPDKHYLKHYSWAVGALKYFGLLKDPLERS